MKTKPIRILFTSPIAFTTLALVGCAGAGISPEASQVQVHAQVSNLLADCKKLGPISVQASDIDGLTTSAYTVAEINLRQAAYDQYKADSVAIINADQMTMGVRLQGIAYSCY